MRHLTVIFLVLLPLTAAAQGPGEGRPLAERWCMACHVIERESPTITPDRGPSFPVIAAKPGTTAESLRRYLSTGHTHMPDFTLSRYESDALIAYILSLR
ncbi:MAG: cytochrome c [Reyranella sp.]|uniref:c-type cytochrome n=1 Tax=Reyranella sp. TaxID=1929291 RepID=UPI0011FD4DDE|nr:cytochrome c [Reyranella sp.]TAJ41051.1 MAG: cytochrome c [Reyranella sp.]